MGRNWAWGAGRGTWREHGAERREGASQIGPYNGQTQLLATPGTDRQSDRHRHTHTQTGVLRAQEPPLTCTGISQSQVWRNSSRCRGCTPSLDSEPQAHNVPTVRPTVPRAWTSGPSTSRGKQKSARRKKPPDHSGPPLAEGRGRRHRGKQSFCPSLVTQLPGTGRRRQPPGPGPDTGRRP